MGKLTTSSFKGEASITSSIAFLPSVISVAFLALAVFMLYFEASPVSTSIEKRLPFAMVRDEESSRIILNIVAGGIISLMVFSFSMVMIVLSQASSNQSPRVIPGLTTVKSHQVVLGIYLGTIIYTLLLLLNFKTGTDGGTTPALAVLLALAFGILCLGLFVYFIHSISKAIQVDNIMNSIFRKAAHALQREEELSCRTKSIRGASVHDMAFTLYNDGNGYMRRIRLTDLLEIARQHDLQVEILVEVGAFTVEGTPLMRLTADPHKDAALVKQLLECFELSEEEVVMEDYEQGVKQLTEIALKALSPGINDPGTATKAIDFLTILFIYKMQSEGRNCLLDEEHKLRVIEKNVPLDELLHRYLSPIRTYGKSDLHINLRLLRCLQNMLNQRNSHDCEAVIAKHALAVVYDADKNIQNLIDRSKLNEAIRHFNKLASHQHQLYVLEVQEGCLPLS